MKLSTRDKIQDLQQSVFQDFFEIQMTAHFGSDWINRIIEYCEAGVNEHTNPSGPLFSYQTIVDMKENKGATMISKTDFDITILFALMKENFIDVCKPKDSGRRVFKNYIRNIKDDKNQLGSHISNLKDIIYVKKLESESLYHVREFIVYLESLGWGSENDNRKEFIEKYKTEISELVDEMSGGGNKTDELATTLKPQANGKSGISIEKVHILVSVQDRNGNIVSGYKLEIKNANNETVASWTSSKEDFRIYIDSGKYRIEVIQAPQGYKTGNAFFFEVSSDNENKRYVKIVERAVSNDALYVKGFGYLVEAEDYPKAITLLTELEQDNHLESIMLLSFLYRYGIGVRKDAEKSRELLDSASFKEDESSWLDYAQKLISERNYIKAVPYCLAYSQRYENGDGFYQAGIIFTSKIKNYKFCKLFFKLALDKGVMDARKPYEALCKRGKDRYMTW